MILMILMILMKLEAPVRAVAQRYAAFVSINSIL